MIARLIGIIGSTHGVRFSARPPSSTISRIASGPRPSNSPCSLTPFSALWTKLQELVGVQVAAGRAEHGEAVERWRCRRRRTAAPAAALSAGAATPAPAGAAGASPLPNAIVAKHRIGCGRRAAAAGDDVERPLAVGGRRRVADLLVARLVAQVHRDDERRRPAAAGATVSCTPIANVVLEHRERLIRAGLLETRSTGGKTISSTVDAGGRVDRQHGRDQQRIARLVRLGVEPFGQRDLQRDARPSRRRDTLARSTSGVTSASGAAVCALAGAGARHRGHASDTEARRETHASSSVTCSVRRVVVRSVTSLLSAESRPAAAAATFGSTVPLTGGRSWNMKSHFHRSDGFDACSQCRASSGRLNASVGQALRAPSPPEARRDVGAHLRGARVVERHAERGAEVHEDLPVLHAPRPAAESRAPCPAAAPARSYRTLPSRRTMRPAARNRRPAPGRSAARPGRSAAAARRSARASTIHDVSPSDPSGPGSKTYSAVTCAGLDRRRSAARSAAPDLVADAARRPGRTCARR